MTHNFQTYDLNWWYDKQVFERECWKYQPFRLLSQSQLSDGSFSRACKLYWAQKTTPWLSFLAHKQNTEAPSQWNYFDVCRSLCVWGIYHSHQRCVIGIVRSILSIFVNFHCKFCLKIISFVFELNKDDEITINYVSV